MGRADPRRHRLLEQPLILAFNRGRLMVLPQAIAKSTGLRQALLALRVSIHNTVGIGDAENDHDLLDACEVGVAVDGAAPRSARSPTKWSAAPVRRRGRVHRACRGSRACPPARWAAGGCNSAISTTAGKSASRCAAGRF